MSILLLVFALVGQGGGKNQHAHDFDYLLGDWEFTGKSQQYGALRGAWSAARVGDGAQVVDEYKVLGPKGEVYYSVVTVRAYDDRRDSWDLVSLHPGTGLKDVGSGERNGAEVHIEQVFRDKEGHAATWRIRYHDIGADRFLWSADRSLDGGETWTIGFQELEVRRVGPARTIESLFGGKR